MTRYSMVSTLPPGSVFVMTPTRVRNNQSPVKGSRPPSTSLSERERLVEARRAPFNYEQKLDDGHSPSGVGSERGSDHRRAGDVQPRPLAVPLVLSRRGERLRQPDASRRHAQADRGRVPRPPGDDQ